MLLAWSVDPINPMLDPLLLLEQPEMAFVGRDDIVQQIEQPDTVVN